MDADVVVVGGGLAGCTTALELAARGWWVHVLERSRHPREKVCGEGLMPHGVQILDTLGLLAAVRDTQPVPFHGIRYVVDDVAADGRFPHGHGLGVRRSRIDAVLAARAAAHPRITFSAGVRVRRIDGRPDAMRVRTSTGVFDGRAVVGADGLHSTVRRELGLRARIRGRRRYGARLHLRHTRPDPDHVAVYVTPRAELYVTPTAPGEVNLAVLLEQDAARALRGDLADAVRGFVADVPAAARWLDGEPASEVRVCGPLRQEATGWVADGGVLVGDAAFFLDGITGEGMSLALGGAVVAASVLDRALASGAPTAERLRAYPRRWRRAVRDKLALTEVVLWGIRHRRLARWAVRRLAAAPRLFGAVLDVNGGHARWPALAGAAVKAWSGADRRRERAGAD